MILYGTRLFGKVDIIPGFGSVQTRFFHIWWIPLMPQESLFVLEGSKQGNSVAGKAIPLDGKSICFAWMRCGLILAGLCTLGWALKSAEGKELVMASALFGLTVLAIIGYGCTLGQSLTKADPQRAVELAMQLEMSEPEIHSMIHAHYPEFFAAAEGDRQSSLSGL